MSLRPGVGGWLQGKTVRKGGGLSTANTRSSTPQGVQSTSSTIFGGGVKDASGRTSEYFVRRPRVYQACADPPTVYGRPVPGVQERPLPEPEAAAARQLVLPQNVRFSSRVL